MLTPFEAIVACAPYQEREGQKQSHFKSKNLTILRPFGHGDCLPRLSPFRRSVGWKLTRHVVQDRERGTMLGSLTPEWTDGNRVSAGSALSDRPSNPPTISAMGTRSSPVP